jgi:hypothetical protein
MWQPLWARTQLQRQQSGARRCLTCHATALSLVRQARGLAWQFRRQLMAAAVHNRTHNKPRKQLKPTYTMPGLTYPVPELLHVLRGPIVSMHAHCYHAALLLALRWLQCVQTIGQSGHARASKERERVPQDNQCTCMALKQKQSICHLSWMKETKPNVNIMHTAEAYEPMPYLYQNSPRSLSPEE